MIPFAERQWPEFTKDSVRGDKSFETLCFSFSSLIPYGFITIANTWWSDIKNMEFSENKTIYPLYQHMLYIDSGSCSITFLSWSFFCTLSIIYISSIDSARSPSINLFLRCYLTICQKHFWHEVWQSVLLQYH